MNVIVGKMKKKSIAHRAEERHGDGGAGRDGAGRGRPEKQSPPPTGASTRAGRAGTRAAGRAVAMRAREGAEAGPCPVRGGAES